MRIACYVALNRVIMLFSVWLLISPLPSRPVGSHADVEPTGLVVHCSLNG